jgi:hypothetical protein
MKNHIAYLLLGMVILSGCQTTQSQRSYRPATPVVGEFIRVDGTGKTPSNATSPQQAEILAREMAKTQAMNRLRERIQTVPVKGGLTLEQCIRKTPSLRPKVENVIQSARIISEHMEKGGAWVEISIRYSDLKSACQ